MTSCDITSFGKNTARDNACSGRCSASACKSKPKVWIIAACDGMISLFEKNSEGARVKPIGQGENKVSPSIEGFNRYLAEALARNAFDQLILVGSNSDISWTHHTLPEAAHKNIIAEIKYPLVPEWFRQNGLKQISIALEQLLSA